MRLALFQPDQAGNVGTLIRTTAALGVALDIIEPCGFTFSMAAIRRAAMDYTALADVTRHADWAAFVAATPGRLVLLTTQAVQAHTAVAWRADDVLIVGRESLGAADFVHKAAAVHARIPLRPPARSLNVAVAAAIALGEAIRATGGFDG
jgi:tRNA (cytidine/uridine-2'-O-)-methyltransferase